MNVPIRLTGTATAGMMVARILPMNRKTTSTTSANASLSVLITSRIVSLTKVVESNTTLAFIPLGNLWLTLVSVSLTRAAVLTALAPGAR